jgi:hypothetical protein
MRAGSFGNYVLHAQLLQLLGGPEVIQAAAALIGQEVEVNASAAAAKSRHHHTAMMLEATSIQPRKPSAQER